MLSTIIDDTARTLGIDPQLSDKLVTFIDRLKIQGQTGGYAFSKFGDYVNMLQLNHTHTAEALDDFFIKRWSDHRVWIEVPEDLKHFLNTDTPLFTPNRMEPHYNDVPFYEQGIEKVAPGTYGNPHNGYSVRSARPLTEDFSNFIVHANLPDEFYIEVRNSNLHSVLSEGFPATGYDNPYKVYSDVVDARDSLFRDLNAVAGLHGKKHVATDFTLVAIDTNCMVMDNNVFYTRKLHGHRQGTRAYGYFYVGAVPPRGVAVSPLNKTI